MTEKTETTVVATEKNKAVAWEDIAPVAFAVASEGKGIPEIAKRLGMKPGTVSIRLSDARKTAREAGMSDEEIVRLVCPSFTTVKGKQAKKDRAYFEALAAKRTAPVPPTA